MARKKVSRNLARLPSASTLRTSDHRAARLLEILRGVAVKNQRQEPRAFYSVREIATRFRVPLSTVSRIYHDLEREGLVDLVRSSKTILHGREYDRHLSVRAFIGLPASLSAFVTIQDYRMFFVRIRRELRLRGFGTAMAFFQPEEARSGQLSERLKKDEVDVVIWFSPPAKAKETVSRLSDAGIRFLGVCDGSPTVLPCRYYVRRENAIEKLLVEWKTRYAVSKITIIESRDFRSAAAEETLQTVADELQIETVTAAALGRSAEAFLRALTRTKTGGIVFPCSSVASKFCFRTPAMVTELLRSQRVAFLGGPVNMPFAKVPDAQVDLITVDWQKVAESIVRDLITQDAFQLRSTIFEAQTQIRVPLSRFAENI